MFRFLSPFLQLVLTSRSMFYHLQYIHLFRPFLKYSPSASPLPPHVSPRRICTANAGFISKLMRLYKKLYNLRQICNIAVYMLHSACTIHLLNLPEKTARRDVIHGVKHLEEIAEDWLCARRTLSIISVLARKWNCELPDEAAAVLQRTDEKYGYLVTTDVPSPGSQKHMPSQFSPSPPYLPLAPPAAQPPPSAPDHLDHRVATSMAQDVPISATMQPAEDFLSSLGSVAPASIQSLEMPGGSNSNNNNNTTSTSQNNNNNNNNANMASFAAPDNSWTMSGISQPAMPRYYQTFAPVGQQQRPTSGPSAAGSSRQRPQNAQYALDGKDWFLKDGVNWQQNFESWGMGTSPVNTSNDNKSGGGGDMFMFKGAQLDLGDGWDFDSSMTNLDLLPGLD